MITSSEEVARAGEHRPRRLLHTRAGGVEQPHERDALGQRELAQAADLNLTGHAHRSGHHREVVRAHRGQPAVHLAVAGDHAVGGSVHALHRALGEMRATVDAELDERPLVHQQGQSLARRELALLVLAGDLLLSPSQLDLRAPGLQVLHERTQERGLRAGAHQRPFHTGSRF
jgi:hypothetical protein